MKRKRFKPSQEVAKRDNKYVAVDEAVLTTISKHHYVRTPFLERLLPGFRGRTVRNSVRKMFDMSLVLKMPPKNFWSSHIYYITDRGLHKLRTNSPHATNLIRVRGSILPRQYEHSLMICDVTQNIEIGALANGDTVLCLSEILSSLVNPVKKPMSLPYTISYTFTNGKTSTFKGNANPDNAVTIVYAKNGKSRLILIEAERESPAYRNTLTSGSLLRKILAYEDIFRKQPNGKRTIEQLGRENCHVLFVFRTYADMVASFEKVAEELADVMPKSQRYLFGVQETQDDLMNDLSAGLQPEPKPNTAIYTDPLLRIGMPSIAMTDLAGDKGYTIHGLVTRGGKKCPAIYSTLNKSKYRTQSKMWRVG